MNIIVNNTQLRRIIGEIRTVEKEIIGRGWYHKVFPSKRYSDRVYKVGTIEIIDTWIDIFKKNPDLFPIVYHRGYFKNEYDEQFSYVLLEKLDTKKFEDFMDLLDDLITYATNNKLNVNEFIGYTQKSFKLFERYSEEIGKFIDGHLPEISEKFNEFISLLKKLYMIKKDIDAHIFNFGYDKSGKLKCLDI